MSNVHFCDKCGGFVEYDPSVALPTMPMKAKGVCKDCGELHYPFYSDAFDNQGDTNG